ncbi:ribosome hibernation promoting factor [Shewanella psychropiezotolerans]|uniref:Ribosome hibernation promoting factor n=1 Tax=Shewanella psychropiezotolerans TaxID=2593655 RepID=A0ABX5WTC8_9GAMM|nr:MULTISPECIES: ribosome hibernation promoting factor [Shewanella]MBE7214103.1 ribosome hibernation promoting factor [Shewanella benthica]MBL4817480.1 ribosome hibernation promoting factor [Shewanella sp.]MCJ8302856.1 ribosome hibernation promoting factor [Shewanella sp.]MCL1061344.1 ribosome hibernation promoting factor [Shewanella benthica]MPY25111.1 ribosome hibernation promoting factor [Shewanella sp. YLB-07]
MQINLTGHHIEITTSLRQYVEEKFTKLERHFDQINNVHVILNVQKMQQKAEAKLHLAGGEVFAMSENADMYAAIDSLIDKLDRQVIKHKEKLTKH